MTTHTFHVSGTHCASCKILIEDILGEEEGVTRVDVNLSKRLVTLEGDIADEPEMIAKQYSELLAPHHYVLSTEVVHAKEGHTMTILALPIGVVLLFLFYLLQHSGLLHIGFDGKMTPVTALTIGVVASLSSCLAIVGGLVLSLSARIAKDVSRVRPFVLFHLGRVVGFFLLGGVLGSIGGVLQISPFVTTLFGIIAATVMIILGINLLEVVHLTARFQLVLPRGVFDRLTRIEDGFTAPIVVGVGTFFLPCGFTQAMQIFALSTGSFVGGMTIMGMFALGTLPMLALLSFGSFRFAQTRYAPLFFKSAGVVVIGFGVFALSGALASLGIINPLITL
jgi:sulfite exporter TauE/SafE/copper chaperone CopZ